jgi:hypothetical protein
MLETLKEITLEQIAGFIKEWWNQTTWLLGNAVIVGYICYKIFGP